MQNATQTTLQKSSRPAKKAMAKKMTLPDRDIEIGYMVEKVKEELGKSPFTVYKLL